MKKLLLKTGSYTNQQGETKNNYVELGVILQGNDGGEYALIEPTVDLAGVLMKQNAQLAKENKPPKDTLMCGIFDKQQNQQPTGGFQQQQPQQGFQQNQQQQSQGFQQHPNQTGGGFQQDNNPPF